MQQIETDLRVTGMYNSLVVFSALFLSCVTSGESTANVSPQNLHGLVRVQAFDGSVAVLPCKFNTNTKKELPTVEWSKDGLIALLHRYGREEKDDSFQFRTNLFPKRLQDGDISLRISNLQPSDSGIYTCMWMWGESPHKTTVELSVVPEPNCSVVSGENPGVTVECEVSCRLLEPDIVFLDPQGNEIPTEEKSTREKVAVDRCIVKRGVDLQTGVNRVVFRVQEFKGQFWDTEIYITAYCPESCWPTWVTVVGWILFLVSLCVIGVVKLKQRFCKPEERKVPLSQRSSTDSRASDQQSLLKKENEVHQLNKEIRDLQSQIEDKDKKISELQLQLQDKDKIISELQKKDTSPVVCLDQPINHSPKSIQPPAVSPQNQVKPQKLQRQNSNPGPPGPPLPVSAVPRNTSSPDLLSHTTAAAAAFASVGSNQRRTLSDSSSRHKPHPHNPQRRSSFTTPSYFLSNNPYDVLAKLPEES